VSFASVVPAQEGAGIVVGGGEHLPEQAAPAIGPLERPREPTGCRCHTDGHHARLPGCQGLLDALFVALRVLQEGADLIPAACLVAMAEIRAGI
jgi:hypothetical protein